MYDFSHWSHANDRTPSCTVFLCIDRFVAEANNLLHISQVNDFSPEMGINQILCKTGQKRDYHRIPVCEMVCLLRLNALGKRLLHNLQTCGLIPL